MAVLLVLTTAALLASGCGEKDGDAEGPQDTIVRFCRAIEEGDLDGAASLVIPEKRDKLKAGLSWVLGGIYEDLSVDFEDVSAERDPGNPARVMLTSGTVTVSGEGKTLTLGIRDIPEENRYVLVQKRGDEWLLDSVDESFLDSVYDKFSDVYELDIF